VDDLQITRDLVNAIRAGNRLAFDALFTRAGAKVYVYIHGRMGRLLRRVVDAEDVLQEVYVKAFEAFDEFADRGRGSFGRWLVGIAQNQIRRLHKHHFASMKRDPRREVPLADPAGGSDAAAAPHPPAPSEASPSRVIARNEETQRVCRAMEALEAEARELLLRHVYEGALLSDIARAEGIPASTLGSRLARALERLETLLN